MRVILFGLIVFCIGCSDATTDATANTTTNETKYLTADGRYLTANEIHAENVANAPPSEVPAMMERAFEIQNEEAEIYRRAMRNPYFARQQRVEDFRVLRKEANEIMEDWEKSAE